MKVNASSHLHPPISAVPKHNNNSLAIWKRLSTISRHNSAKGGNGDRSAPAYFGGKGRAVICKSLTKDFQLARGEFQSLQNTFINHG